MVHAYIDLTTVVINVRMSPVLELRNGDGGGEPDPVFLTLERWMFAQPKMMPVRKQWELDGEHRNKLVEMQNAAAAAAAGADQGGEQSSAGQGKTDEPAGEDRAGSEEQEEGQAWDPMGR